VTRCPLALSRTTTYTREATSQRIEAIVDPLNRRTELGYDGMGRVRGGLGV
jgi:hypothetical protein